MKKKRNLFVSVLFLSIPGGYRIIDLDYRRGNGIDELGTDFWSTGPHRGMTIIFDIFDRRHVQTQKRI